MTATAASAALLTRSPRHTELHLGPLTELRVDARPSPLITLLSIVVDALGGPAQGTSPELVRMVRKAVPADAAYDVCSVFDSTGALFPDCVPLVADRDSMSALFDDIAEVRSDTLWRSVVELFDGVPPLVWQIVLQRPERWLQQLVRVLAAAWRLYEPIWRRTSALRARESDRVAAATEVGDLDVVLAGLSPRTRYSQETLYLPDRFPYRTEMGRRQLVLVPLTSGRQASVFNLDLPDEAWVGYPLPGASGPLAGNGSNGDAAPEALTLLLGPMRASILCALHQPATMGALARRLNAAPSTVTYHCGQLADAGLVARQRHGREVRVKRTDRGGAVVDALS